MGVSDEILAAPQFEPADDKTIAAGKALFNYNCAGCHGGNATSAGMIPDLRYSINRIAPAWDKIVIDGALESNGMPRWSDYLTNEEAGQIMDYVVHEARLGHARGERRIVRKW